MIEMIIREINSQSNYLQETIETIYFGGGTPSILSMHQIEKIFIELNQAYDLSKVSEVTLEANPDDLNSNKLADFKQLGINRLSVGIQSFNDDLLKKLNRVHTRKDALKSIEMCRKSGFDNLNLDIIFALPGASLNDLKEDIQQLLSFQPEHISAYNLTIEEKTVFGNWLKNSRISEVSEDFAAQQYGLLIEQLLVAGYDQYEISNFAKPGFLSVHNSNYWKNKQYLGIGPGAHSFNGHSRRINVANNQKYLNLLQAQDKYYEEEQLTIKDQINEYLLTTLRTKWGCDLDYLQQNFSFDLAEVESHTIKLCIAQDLVSFDNNHLKLTSKGKFLADAIIGDLFQI